MTETTEPELEVRGSQERVEFWTGFSGQWFFRRVAANNEKVAVSEGYQNHADAYMIAAKIFRPVPWWEQQNDGNWRQVQMSEIEDELNEKLHVIPEEELLDPQPELEQPEAPADAVDGPEPEEAPVEE
jgi:hypothetical protein